MVSATQMAVYVLKGHDTPRRIVPQTAWNDLGFIAVLQFLYTESTMISGFFLKKKPPCTELNRAHELENSYSPRGMVSGNSISMLSRLKMTLFVADHTRMALTAGLPMAQAAMLWGGEHFKQSKALERRVVVIADAGADSRV